MKIIIDKNEKIMVDNSELLENKINSEFLENVVNEGLKNNLDLIIECDESMPLAKLFLDIKNMVAEGSEFRKELEKLDDSIKEIEDVTNENEMINDDELISED